MTLDSEAWWLVGLMIACAVLWFCALRSIFPKRKDQSDAQDN